MEVKGERFVRSEEKPEYESLEVMINFELWSGDTNTPCMTGTETQIASRAETENRLTAAGGGGFGGLREAGERMKNYKLVVIK